MKEWWSRESSTSGYKGGDKRHDKAPQEKKKKVDPNTCCWCRKIEHWAKECPTRKPEKEEAHLARADDDDEHTLLKAGRNIEEEGRQSRGALQQPSTSMSHRLKSASVQ